LAAFGPVTSQQVGCDTALFQLNLDNSTELQNSCNVFNQGNYIIGPPVATPEPGSLALIIGGVTAVWAVRRRKRAA